MKKQPLSKVLSRQVLKTLLCMKIIVALLFASTLQVYANDGKSQERIDVEFKEIKLSKALKQIEKNSQYRFVFSNNVLNENMRVTLSVKQALISDVLTKMLSSTSLTFEKLDYYLFVIRSKAETIAWSTIKGRVLKDDGTPLEGATVSLKGSAARTQTDANGYFELLVENTREAIEISYTGFQTATINVKDIGADYSVVLKPNENTMDEVVVIGYGTTKKRNTTGAISSVKAKDLSLGSSTNVLQALAGRSPGVVAIQSSGQPGASVQVKLRDNPSQVGGSPLYVVDGVIVNDAAGDPGTDTRYGNGGVDRSPYNFINPNDIESIEFIKDASAASIYGARAGSGVVLITTKKGVAGQTRVDYSGNFTFTKAKNFYDVFSTKEYMGFRNQLLREDWKAKNGVIPYGTKTEAEVDLLGQTNPAYRYIAKYTQSQIDNATDINPVDAILQSGSFFQHNLSVSGGTGKTRYALSGNVVNNQGVIKGSDYIRAGGRASIISEISKKVRMGVNINYTSSKANNSNVSKGQNENSGIILSALYHPPTIPLIDNQGNYPLNPDYTNSPNPLSFLTVTDFSLDTRFLTSGYMEIEPIKNLVYKFSASYDRSDIRRNLYQPRTFLYGANNNGLAQIRDASNATYLLENTLNYRKDIGLHSFNALAGYSYQKPKWWGVAAGSTNHLTDNFLYNSLGSGNIISRPGSWRGQSQWASFFGRLMYSFNDRYLLSASLRRDGYSDFAPNKKWGNFASVSAGWVMSEESFVKNLKFVDFLKLRAAYGTTGNANVTGGYSEYAAGWTNWAFGVTPVQSIGVYYASLGNPNLSWEKVAELNIGIDFAVLKNRITGSFDVFNKTVSGLLDLDQLPSDFIVSSVAANIGKTRSKGWELGIQSKNIVSKNGGFEWKTDIVLSQYKSNWVKRSAANLAVLPKYANENDPYRAIYTQLNDGIYVGGPKPVQQPNIQPGQFILRDINGYDATTGELTGKPDGKLDGADRVLLGTSDPKLSFGFTNSFRYKNFDLNIHTYGMKRIRYNSDVADFWNPAMISFGWNRQRIMSTGWSSTNQSSNRPSILGGGDGGDYWYQNATFLRCREISLGYTIPANLLQRQNVMKNLRFSVAVQNPFIITKYKGFDPELDNFLSYPNPLGVMIGVNVGF